MLFNTFNASVNQQWSCCSHGANNSTLSSVVGTETSSSPSKKPAAFQGHTQNLTGPTAVARNTDVTSDLYAYVLMNVSLSHMFDSNVIKYVSLHQ